MRLHTIALMLVVLPTLAAAATDAAPSGHYCGRLLSSGHMVDADTSLALGQDGRIVGTYRFRGGNTATDGKLQEAVKEPGRMKMLRWADKYGDGWLVITFDPAFTRFDGLWGSGDAVPDLIWTGARCQEANS